MKEYIKTELEAIVAQYEDEMGRLEELLKVSNLSTDAIRLDTLDRVVSRVKKVVRDIDNRTGLVKEIIENQLENGER